MTPERFRAVISGVLLTGVLVSSVLLVLGLLTAAVVGWDGSLRDLPPSAVDPTEFSGVIRSLVELRPIGFAQAGLLVLVATPVVRVLASAIGFALEGDRAYAAMSLAVLAILLGSLFLLR